MVRSSARYAVAMLAAALLFAGCREDGDTGGALAGDASGAADGGADQNADTAVPGASSTGPDSSQDRSQSGDVSSDQDAADASVGDVNSGENAVDANFDVDGSRPIDVPDGALPEPALAYPFREGSCELWTQVPWSLATLPAESEDGLWAVGIWDRSVSQTALMQYRNGQWSMSSLPREGITVEALGTAALVTDKIYVRRNGAWMDVTPTRTDAAVNQSFEDAWGSGKELLVTLLLEDRSQQFFRQILRYDGSTWSETPYRTTAGHVWSEGAAIYQAHAGGVARFADGTWKELFTPNGGGYLGVAGLSASTVFAINGAGIFQVSGDSLTTLPGLDCGAGTAQYASISSGPGKVLVSGSCTGGGPRFWTNDGNGWQTVSIPAMPDGGTLSPPRMTRSGAIFALSVDSSGATPWKNLFRLSPSSWDSMTTIARPPARVLTGRSSSELYAGDSSGLARLSSDGLRWTAPPGVSALDVRGLWQSPTGTLFIISYAGDCVYRAMGQTTLWRYDGSHLVRDLDLTTACGRFDVRGRTDGDVYASIGASLYHWNGSSWGSPVTAPCLFSDVASLAPLGTKGVAVNCFSTNDVHVYAFDGGSWPTIATPDTSSLGSIGPSDNPLAYAISMYVPDSGGSYLAGQDAGWMSGTFPGGFVPRGVRGPDSKHLVAWGYALRHGFARTDGSSPWVTTVNWVTESAVQFALDVGIGNHELGNLERFWSDGRWVASAADLNHKNAIARCDLGP